MSASLFPVPRRQRERTTRFQGCHFKPLNSLSSEVEMFAFAAHLALVKAQIAEPLPTHPPSVLPLHGMGWPLISLQNGPIVITDHRHYSRHREGGNEALFHFCLLRSTAGQQVVPFCDTLSRYNGGQLHGHPSTHPWPLHQERIFPALLTPPFSIFDGGSKVEATCGMVGDCGQSRMVHGILTSNCI